MDFDWSEVGLRIRTRRLTMKQTQHDLAVKAGMTQNAIFRLEAGNTNPQIGTLRSVARALGMTVRDLVCGVAESDLRLADRLVAVKRIIESGDSAAKRAMDHGLENAQALLDRTIRNGEKEPQLLGVGEKTIQRSVKNEGITLAELQDRSAFETQAMSVPRTTRRAPKILPNTKKEIRMMNGYQLDDALDLPVGNAITIALPNSNRHEEQHANSSELAARADSESTRR